MLLITLGMLALGYVFWNYWEQPTSQQITAVQTETDSLQAIIDKAKQDLTSGTVEDLRRKVEAYRALLGVMRRLVPEKNEVPALIDDISTKAKVRGVTIGRIEPQPVEPGQPFDTYKYRLEIIGHYDQLGEFLSDIASLRRIIVPQDSSLKPAQQQAMRFLRDTTTRPDSASPRLVRETFGYEGGGRDPFLSLLKSGDIRPLLTDLKLVGIYYDGRYPARSVAILRDVTNNKVYRARTGEILGRLKVTTIRPREIVFTVQEFGFERQESLQLAKQEVTP